MIDVSHLLYEGNIRLTTQVVELSHSYNVTVEGESGVLSRVEGSEFIPAESLYQTGRIGRLRETQRRRFAGYVHRNVPRRIQIQGQAVWSSSVRAQNFQNQDNCRNRRVFAQIGKDQCRKFLKSL